MVIRGGIQCGLRILWTICLCDSLIRVAKKEETQRVESLLVAEKGFEPMTFGL